MNDTLDRMLEKDYEFKRFIVDGIDNETVFAINAPEMREQETLLVSRQTGDSSRYLESLNHFLSEAMDKKLPGPVVRFADGEYAFYAGDLSCNGLYCQAESRKAIREAMPFHLEAFKSLLSVGKAAPLIFPGNAHKPDKGFFSFFKKSKHDSSARIFLDFLTANGLSLNDRSYIPFYCIYAYLTSRLFFQLVDKRTVCIINSDNNDAACRQWFSENESKPELRFVSIPNEYVATRWPTIRARVMADIPQETEICLVGAGVGALPVCADIALQRRLPVIDAGHVINMMNDLVIKSKGERLYTLWRATI